jgi:hypothetical protein
LFEFGKGELPYVLRRIDTFEDAGHGLGEYFRVNIYDILLRLAGYCYPKATSVGLRYYSTGQSRRIIVS